MPKWENWGDPRAIFIIVLIYIPIIIAAITGSCLMAGSLSAALAGASIGTVAHILLWICEVGICVSCGVIVELSRQRRNFSGMINETKENLALIIL